jgi:hypothetical protein
MTLITKAQYGNFEQGEFTERKQRSYEETIQLIEAFPWEEQRRNLQVNLTGASITIEGKDGNFLKLALYYHGKFILYYLDADHRLFEQSYLKCSDTYSFILAFFRDGAAPVDFKQQHTFLQNVSTHFKDRDFSYRMTPGKITALALLGCFFGLMLSSWIPIVTVRGLPTASLPFLILPAVMSIFLIGQVPLTINHYRAARGRLLVISAGKSEFFYGPAHLPKSYDKSEILEMVTYGMRGRGGGYNWLTRVELSLRNGTSINISCLIISRSALTGKLPACPQREKKVLFPFIPLSASIPS